MINIIKEPEVFSYSKNPIYYILQETDGVITPAKSIMHHLDSPADGDTFTIVIKEGENIITSDTFTFKTNPTPGVYSEINLGTVAEIATELNKNILIAPYYDVEWHVSIGDQRIQFLAKEFNANQAVEITTSIASVVVEQIEPNIGSLDNYSIEIDVLFENGSQSDDWILLTTISDIPDSLGKIHFQIDELINNAIQARKIVPKNFWDSNNIEKDQENDYQFSIRYKIYSGTPPTLVSKFVFQKRTAIFGGIAQNIWANHGFTSHPANSMQTYWPLSKTIIPDQKELISYLSSGFKPIVKVFATTYDGAQSTQVIQMHQDASSRDKKTWTIPIGPGDLSLGDDIAYYDIAIFVDDNGTERVDSPYRRYFIDRDYYGKDVRQLMYYNALECPEVIHTTGNLSKNLKIRREVAERIITTDYSDLFAQNYQHQAAWENYFTYRTGFLTAKEADALQELFISNQVFEIFDEGFIPILIKTNSFKVTESRKGLHSYTFLAIPKLKQKNYSNHNRIFDFNPPQGNGWAIAETDFWRMTFGLPWEIA